MFEMIVEDIFTITGRGTVFLGKIRSGSVSVGDPIVCKTRSVEMQTRVIGLEEMGTLKLLKTADAGASVGIVCKEVDLSSLPDAFERDGDTMRVVGVTLVLGSKKRWWQF